MVVEIFGESDDSVVMKGNREKENDEKKYSGISKERIMFGKENSKGKKEIKR